MRRNKYIGYILLLALLLWGTKVDPIYATECTHEYESQIIRFAEPEVDGERKLVCIYCGDTYTEVIPKTGHVYGEFQIEQEPTCGETGLKYKECQECGKREYEEIPFLNEHRFSKWSVVQQADCENTGIRQRVCVNCGQSEEEVIAAAAGHVYEEFISLATCTEEGELRYTCIHCGDSYIEETTPALGHRYGEEVIQREPSAEEEGLAVRTCENDPSHIIERMIPKLAVPETETEGETEKKIVAQESAKKEEPIKEINPVEATVAGANVFAFGVLFVLIKMDLNVLSWEKRNRKLMHEKGEWE